MFEKCICLVCLEGPRRPPKLTPNAARVSAFCLLEIAHYCRSGARLVTRLAYRPPQETYGRSSVHSDGRAVASDFCSLSICSIGVFYRS